MSVKSYASHPENSHEDILKLIDMKETRNNSQFSDGVQLLISRLRAIGRVSIQSCRKFLTVVSSSMCCSCSRL